MKGFITSSTKCSLKKKLLQHNFFSFFRPDNLANCSMEHKEYQQRDYQQNILHDDKEAYENLDKKRRREAILSSDTEKFRLFTKLMRISRMVKNAKITQLRKEMGLD